MGKTGKISVIQKQLSTSGIQTQETSLRQHGYTRMPGTGVTILPYREASGKYVTGLDPDATYLKRLSDEEREIEIERIQKERRELEEILEVDLGPRSKFWNFASQEAIKVEPVKLMDGDNIFDLSDPMKRIAYSWLRVHPRIATSYQAWQQGRFPADTQFYVADEEVENAILFQKKASINKAIVRLEDMAPEKRKRIGRLMGLPITDNTLDSVVYNLIDTLLKDVEFKTGEYKGLSTVQLFLTFSEMKEDLVVIKDLVNQAIAHSIYRVKDSGRVFEGELELASSKEDLVSRLYDEDGQEERLALEKKLSAKKTVVR